MSEKERGDIATRIQKGSRLWEARSKHGRNPIWENPEQMLEACIEYFEWVEANPLWETKPMIVNGEVYDAPTAKMRAMTIEGLCVFLGIGRSTWGDYQHKPHFSEVVKFVESTMYEQKLTGAASGLLNSNIIARELKLTDTVNANIGGQAGNPLLTDNLFKIEFVNADSKDKP
jgi:hypothetical protein